MFHALFFAVALSFMAFLSHGPCLALAALSSTQNTSDSAPTSYTDILNLTANATTSSRNARIHCYHPVRYPYFPVNIPICLPTFNTLLSTQIVDTPHVFRRIGRFPIKLTDYPCALSLDTQQLQAVIRISLRAVVDSAIRTLDACDSYGQGGWEHIESNEDWIIIVQQIPDSVKSTSGTSEDGGDAFLAPAEQE